MENLNFIASQLIKWYKKNQRDLPWRNIQDPYKIWVSEIILQQTRVVQGLEYYNRFTGRFPDVKSLAEADEQEVLKYWQGLGYYSRARNLHFAAKTIMNEYNGEFPKDYNKVLKLKGIGGYTAAAITSFAWDMPYPVVDGNVFRFLSRLFAVDEPIDTGKGKKDFTKLAGGLMDKSHAGLFNQAIMEFGALQCIPASPDCSACPFEIVCLAHAWHSIAHYPVKSHKTKTKDLYFYYFHIHDSDSLYINRRSEKGIWQNLFEFPLIESEEPLDFEQLSRTAQFREWFQGENTDFKLIIENRKHVLSHRVLYASFYEVALEKLPETPDKFTKIKSGEIDNYPVHRLMQYYLEEKLNT
ncbi:MAG: A/G-specific adenine glycosylase [Candidatus Symbiothrix sp.]|jgi:A/G-specific adenine glycosylase|nr:A/G-specific adenine glycosylase [Candidatus Symbiothrix sp.]